ncbi:class I adenylate-forming enzyme family protein [Mesorhizobium sp. YR577]|uniref:class I adenylate-forming enzyme family protein n=1 Tax=Mesorhizobium sp. YR577 TaxID=1884373 RepID=UPI0008E55334|nr:class I adenylate-forming enzyme family protein [Mesorhizobium sp. YR577]SFU19413.1 Acyl-CoA synthetase (AMP-forming)/AMP-acid ligase II [Mesorhizobium sp. YR577]
MVMYNNLGAALPGNIDADRISIVDLSGPVRRDVSYSTFDALAEAYARGLKGNGFGSGSRIAVVASNSTTYLAIVYGALRAGITVVPVNYKLPAQLVAFILADAAVELVFCDAARRHLVPDTIRHIDIGDEDALSVFRDFGAFEAVAPLEGDMAMVIYTSGSSGVPKGVIFSHRAHLWALDHRTSLASPTAQRTVVAAPLYHQNGLASSQATLGSGGTVILLPTFEVEAFARAIVEHSVEMITAVPTMIAMLMRRADLLRELDFSKVKLVRVSSAPSSPELFADIARIFRNARIVNGFGTTEGGPIFFGPHPDGIDTPQMSVGCAHPDVDLRLMRDGRPVEDEGVLEVKSRAVMMGYLNRPDLTAKAMTADGFYSTGDIFRRDTNGFFFFVSRADDMFVCGGENVFPGDVEAILGRHPAIAEVSVIPLADEIKGHKPVAFVVAHANATVTEDEIKAFALANGPACQHPRKVYFLPEMPLAGTNKIDRNALARSLNIGSADATLKVER